MPASEVRSTWNETEVTGALTWRTESVSMGFNHDAACTGILTSSCLVSSTAVVVHFSLTSPGESVVGVLAKVSNSGALFISEFAAVEIPAGIPAGFSQPSTDVASGFSTAVGDADVLMFLSTTSILELVLSDSSSPTKVRCWCRVTESTRSTLTLCTLLIRSNGSTTETLAVRGAGMIPRAPKRSRRTPPTSVSFVSHKNKQE